METGALTGERENYRLTRPIQAIEIPATVQVILAARIDRLPPEDKELLQTASVIGKDVPFVLLHAIADLPDHAVQERLTRLQAAEFVYETRLFPDPEYTFKHALTHEVTYGTLLQDRRKALHARIVDAMERLYPDRLIEHVERLAHHAVRGQTWEQAVTYVREAGAKEFARRGNREAVTYFEQALMALAHLPETREKLEHAAIVHGPKSIRLAESLDHPFSMANTCWHRAYLETIRGEVGSAILLLERGRALSHEWDLIFTSLNEEGGLGYAYALSGRIAEGISLLEHAVTASETMALGVVQALFLGYLARPTPSPAGSRTLSHSAGEP